jgi:hypothetical protein
MDNASYCIVLVFVDKISIETTGKYGFVNFNLHINGYDSVRFCTELNLVEDTT